MAGADHRPGNAALRLAPRVGVTQPCRGRDDPATRLRREKILWRADPRLLDGRLASRPAMTRRSRVTASRCNRARGGKEKLRAGLILICRREVEIPDLIVRRTAEPHPAFGVGEE